MSAQEAPQAGRRSPSSEKEVAGATGDRLLRDLAERLAAATSSERVVVSVAESISRSFNVAYAHVSVERGAAGAEPDAGNHSRPSRPLVGSAGVSPESVTGERTATVVGPDGESIGKIWIVNRRDRDLGPDDQAELDATGRLVGALLGTAAAEPDLSSQAEGAFIALAAALDTHDDYIEGRAARVGAICSVLAEELGLDPGRLLVLRGAAAVYDCGNLTTPDLLLHKPEPLTAGEILAIQHHVQRTLEILRRIDLPAELEDVRVIAAQHHERFDGTGYPLGLRGHATLLESRILAVADVLDAMLSERPYRPPIPAGAALDHIRQGSGTLFDPAVVEGFERCADRLLETWEDRT